MTINVSDSNDRQRETSQHPQQCTVPLSAAWSSSRRTRAGRGRDAQVRGCNSPPMRLICCSMCSTAACKCSVLHWRVPAARFCKQVPATTMLTHDPEVGEVRGTPQGVVKWLGWRRVVWCGRNISVHAKISCDISWIGPQKSAPCLLAACARCNDPAVTPACLLVAASRFVVQQPFVRHRCVSACVCATRWGHHFV